MKKYRFNCMLFLTAMLQIVASMELSAAIYETVQRQDNSISLVTSAIKPDYVREQRLAAEILPGVFIGEPIFLTLKNKHKFLGLLSVPDDTHTRMGVVIVHGMGAHPDWGLISTIRQQLYEYDYTTLSIQMPMLAANASREDYKYLFADAVERIKVAVAYLKKNKHQPVILVSHSNGSRVSHIYSLDSQSDIDAWVSLGLMQGDTFEGIRIPVFDVYGGQDLSHVLASAEKRKYSLDEDIGSRQMLMLGTDHFYNGKVDLLTLEIKRFLDALQ